METRQKEQTLRTSIARVSSLPLTQADCFVAASPQQLVEHLLLNPSVLVGICAFPSSPWSVEISHELSKSGYCDVSSL